MQIKLLLSLTMMSRMMESLYLSWHRLTQQQLVLVLDLMLKLSIGSLTTRSIVRCLASHQVSRVM